MADSWFSHPDSAIVPKGTVRPWVRKIGGTWFIYYQGKHVGSAQTWTIAYVFANMLVLPEYDFFHIPPKGEI